MSNIKKNTIAGQYEEYLKKPIESFLDWIRVPQQGEPGYRDISKELASRYPSKAEETVKPTPETPIQPMVPNSPLALEQPKQEMNPIVKDYLSKKLQASKAPASSSESIPTQESLPALVKKPDYMDKFNDEAYAKAKADSESRQDGLGWLQFAAGFGDALAQRSPSESAKNFDKIRANIKDETIGQFQRDKAQAVEDFKNKQQIDLYNPESESSKSFRKMIEAQFPNVAKSYGANWANVTAADKEYIFDPLKLKESIEARKDQARILSQTLAEKKLDREYEKNQLLQTPFGLANTQDDAKQLKEAYESKRNFDNKIQELIDLRTKYGGEMMNREAVSRGKQLSKDLLLEYKNMAKLGVLSKSDEDIINAIIPADPLGFSLIPGQDPIMNNLKKFKEDSDKDFSTRVQTRTRAGTRSLQQSGVNSNNLDGSSNQLKQNSNKPSWAK